MSEPNGRISLSPDVEYDRLPLKEELVQVRTSDLRHLKRDINAIPDGQGRFDNAFWGFAGIGAPPLADGLIALAQHHTAGAGMFFGVACMIAAITFKLFGLRARGERDNAKSRILENIDDFSTNP